MIAPARASQGRRRGNHRSCGWNARRGRGACDGPLDASEVQAGILQRLSGSHDLFRRGSGAGRMDWIPDIRRAVSLTAARRLNPWREQSSARPSDIGRARPPRMQVAVYSSCARRASQASRSFRNSCMRSRAARCAALYSCMATGASAFCISRLLKIASARVRAAFSSFSGMLGNARESPLFR
jgi:hypothetical protein